jgi:hypothetical protein
MSGRMSPAEFVPLAPAIPAGLLALLGLVAFLGYLVATGTLKVYAVSLGALILRLADLLDFGFTIVHRRVHPFGTVSHGLRLLDVEIRDALASLALEAEHGASWMFTQAGNIMAWTGREIGDLAETTAKALHLQRVTTIPAAIRAASAHALDRLRLLDRKIGHLGAQADAQWARLRHGIDRLDGRLSRELARDYARVTSEVGVLARDLRGIGSRVRATEHKLGAKAFAGAVAVSLVAIFGPWIRCPSFRRVGKRIGCGGFAALEDLLAPLVAVFTVLELCQYALATQRLARLIVPQLGDVLLVQGAICLGGGASLPSAHDRPRLSTKITLPSGIA